MHVQIRNVLFNVQHICCIILTRNAFIQLVTYRQKSTVNKKQITEVTKTQ